MLLELPTSTVKLLMELALELKLRVPLVPVGEFITMFDEPLVEILPVPVEAILPLIVRLPELRFKVPLVRLKVPLTNKVPPICVLLAFPTSMVRLLTELVDPLKLRPPLVPVIELIVMLDEPLLETEPLPVDEILPLIVRLFAPRANVPL